MLQDFLGLALQTGAVFDETDRATSEGGTAFYQRMYDLQSDVIEKEPCNAKAWFLLGVAAQGNQWLSEALHDVTESHRVDPQFARAYLVRSEILAFLGRYDMARADRQEAIALDPKVVQ